MYIYSRSSDIKHDNIYISVVAVASFLKPKSCNNVSIEALQWEEWQPIKVMLYISTFQREREREAKYLLVANSTCCFNCPHFWWKDSICRWGGFLHNIVPHTAGRTSPAKICLAETTTLHESFTRSSPRAFRQDSGSSWSGLKSSKNKKQTWKWNNKAERLTKKKNEFAWKKKGWKTIVLLWGPASVHATTPFNLTGALPFGKAIPMPRVEISFRQILPSGLSLLFFLWYKQPKIHPQKPMAGTWKYILEKEKLLQYSPIFGFQTVWFRDCIPTLGPLPA